MTAGNLVFGSLGHLPLLAVLFAGFSLLTARRAQLSGRGILLARLGLGALLLGAVLQVLSTVLVTLLYRSFDYSAGDYAILWSGAGLGSSLLSAGGVGLLIAALVTRNPGPAPGPPRPPPDFPGPPSDGHGFTRSPSGGQGFTGPGS